MKVVAFCGLEGAGKDTAAQVFLDRGWRRMAFADKLKEVVADVYDLPIEWMYDPELKKTPHANLGGNTPRFALQHLGTEGFREVNAITWVQNIANQFIRIEKQDQEHNAKWWRKLLTKVGFNKPRETCVAICDLRFPNEAAFLLSIGAYIVYVVRGEVQAYNHASENQVAEIGEKYARMKIENNGTIDDLHQNALTAYSEVINEFGSIHLDK